MGFIYHIFAHGQKTGGSLPEQKKLKKNTGPSNV